MLQRDYGFLGSYQAVRRYLTRRFPGAPVQAIRRVETPPGVQAQHDWFECTGRVGGVVQPLYGLIGTLSGIVGAGGGFVSVPFMTWCGVRIHNAVATSAALGFPIALSGTLSNIWFGWGEPGLPAYSLGFIYLPALAIIVLASVSMAPLGARTAHKMPVRQLQKVFAVILYALAAYMFWKAAH